MVACACPACKPRCDKQISKRRTSGQCVYCESDMHRGEDTALGAVAEILRRD